MHRKFPWLVFFIILFSTSSICLLFIPYQETRHLDQRSENAGTLQYVVFPWRSFNQEISFNISVNNGTSSLTILLDSSDILSFMRGEPYGYYWKVENITLFESTIQITPSFQGYLFISVLVDDFAGEEASLYYEITVYYWRYASSYGFVFLGVAVILISYYGYRRYKWR